MKNLFVGFIIGCVFSLGVFYWWGSFNSQATKLSNNNHKVALNSSLPNIVERNASPVQHQVKKNVKKQEVREVKKTEIMPGKQQTQQPARRENLSKIIEKLDGYSAKDLEVVMHMLDAYQVKSPEQIFEEENIDYEWAPQRQTDLEYDFYAESPLRELADLESIKCHTSICKVSVIVPGDLKIRPSHVMDWQNPSTVIHHQIDEQNGRKQIDLYLPRHVPDFK